MKKNNLVIYVSTIVTLGIGTGIGICLYNSSRKRAKMMKEAQNIINSNQMIFDQENDIQIETSLDVDKQKIFLKLEKRKYTELLNYKV